MDVSVKTGYKSDHLNFVHCTTTTTYFMSAAFSLRKECRTDHLKFFFHFNFHSHGQLENCFRQNTQSPPRLFENWERSCAFVLFQFTLEDHLLVYTSRCIWASRFFIRARALFSASVGVRGLKTDLVLPSYGTA